MKIDWILIIIYKMIKNFISKAKKRLILMLPNNGKTFFFYFSNFFLFFVIFFWMIFLFFNFFIICVCFAVLAGFLYGFIRCNYFHFSFSNVFCMKSFLFTCVAICKFFFHLFHLNCFCFQFFFIQIIAWNVITNKYSNSIIVNIIIFFII